MNNTEKLNLWDRFFNRHRKEIHNRGEEIWNRSRTLHGVEISSNQYTRCWIEYKVFDRVTGSVTIEKEYLD